MIENGISKQPLQSSDFSTSYETGTFEKKSDVLSKIENSLKSLNGWPSDIVRNESGKPILVLPGTKKRSSIQMNLSHSKDRYIYCISNECEVGVDIELVRPIHKFIEISKKYFSANEQAWILRADTNPHSLLASHHRFLQLWTLKEAIIKCLGTTIGQELKNINFNSHQLDSIENNINCSQKAGKIHPKANNQFPLSFKWNNLICFHLKINDTLASLVLEPR